MRYADLFRLDGKTALITGSSKGIGRAIAEAMAAQGASVVISSRKLDACRAVADEIAAAGGKAAAIACNISRREELAALVAGARQAFGKIDILVCNAAVNPHFGPLATLGDEAYRKTLDANIGANLWLANMVIPEMAARRDGSVVILSSIAGLKGTKSIGIYGITKAADLALARNLAVEWGHANVRVNCLCPAIVRTDMARALWENPATYKAAVALYPLGRIGEVQDIAGAAVFLASKAGAFVTGQQIVIDGGATIGGEA
jgi:NAD(P)-dependent dehydrogenase (short-subunit alcohol dehydrogenase family)